MKFIIIFSFFSMAFAHAGIGTDVVSTIDSMVSIWTNLFSSYGANILYGLALIDLVITFGLMAIKGEFEFTGIMYALVRMILIIGFWLLLMGNTGVYFLKSIIDSFKILGPKASGSSITADNMFDEIGKVYAKLFSDLTFSIEGLMLAAIGLIVAIVLIKVVVKLLSNLVFATLSIYMAALFFPFGVIGHTRAWAINGLVNAMRYGARYMGTLIMIGLAIGFVNKISELIGQKGADSNLMFSMLIFALLLHTLAEGIEDFIDGYITGLGGGSNFAAGQMLKQIASNTASTARNIAQGAKGGGGAAMDKIKDANAAATAAGTATMGAGKATAGVMGGAAVGAMSGMARGAMGFKTHSAGKASGGKVGEKVSATTHNNAKSQAQNGSNNTNTSKNTTTPPKTEATQASLKPGDKGFYHSSVPKGTK